MRTQSTNEGRSIFIQTFDTDLTRQLNGNGLDATFDGGARHPESLTYRLVCPAVYYREQHRNGLLQAVLNALVWIEHGASPGDVIATVSSLRDTYDVVATHGGTIVEWLAEDGDPIAPGQPVREMHIYRQNDGRELKCAGLNFCRECNKAEGLAS